MKLKVLKGLKISLGNLPLSYDKETSQKKKLVASVWQFVCYHSHFLGPQLPGMDSDKNTWMKFVVTCLSCKS